MHVLHSCMPSTVFDPECRYFAICCQTALLNRLVGGMSAAWVAEKRCTQKIVVRLGLGGGAVRSHSLNRCCDSIKNAV